MGGCESTFFKLQNKTVKKLTTKIIWLDECNFSLPNRPDLKLNDHTVLPDGYLREQVNVYYSATGNWFHLELSFDDAHTTKLLLEIDQSLATGIEASFLINGDTAYYDVSKSISENELSVTIRDSAFGLKEIEELKKKSKEMLRALEEEKLHLKEQEECRKKLAEEYAEKEQKMIVEEALTLNEVGLNLLGTAAICGSEMKENAVRLCVEAVEMFDKAAAISANENVKLSFLQAIHMLTKLFAFNQVEKAEEMFQKHFPKNEGLLFRKDVTHIPQYDGILQQHLAKQSEKSETVFLTPFN